VDGVLGAAGDEGHVQGGHCGCMGGFCEKSG
jgi:hypothetical protein